MGFFKFIIFPIFLGLGVGLYLNYSPNEKFELPNNGYFGRGKVHEDNKEIKAFEIAVENKTIEDLKLRLKNARISHEVLEDSDNFNYGFNSKELLKIRDHWLNKYDWKKYEKILNSFSNFKTEIEGIQIHFIHQKPPANTYKSIKPLLVVHGWPGNVFEFNKLIPILVNPKKFKIDSEFAFEVVAPSIPGYGWSDQPRKTGFSQAAAARVFRKLMERLGHQQFYLQGGDWGSVITSILAKAYPNNVKGLHLNTIFTQPGANFATLLDVVGTFLPIFSSENIQKRHNIFEKLKTLIVETGYMHLQATKPDTIGTTLNDSPLGLAAYILEKFSTWTNPENRGLKDGGLTKRFELDDLLTIVMIYWTNGNIVSSQRFYREAFIDKQVLGGNSYYTSIPTGHASGLNEFYDRNPIEISRQFFNITHYTEIDAGHFMALEKPLQLAQSVFEFVKDL